MTRSVKFLLVFVLFSITFLSQKNLVLAKKDNNDSAFAACDITIGSVSVTPGDPKEEVFASRAEGNDSFYEMRVCGAALSERLGDQEDTPINCMDAGDDAGPSRQELMVSINTSLWTWRDFSLSNFDGSCYSGTITASSGQAWETGGVDMDVELDNDDDHICRKEMPVCRRVKVKFNRDVVEDNVSQCDDFITEQNTCGFLNINNGDRIDLGEAVTISGQVDPRTTSADCGLDEVNVITLRAIDPSDDQVFREEYVAGENFNINKSFIPSGLGVYFIEYQAREFYTIVNIDNARISCTVQVRVCAPGAAECESTVEPDEEGGDGDTEDAQSYEICRSNLQPESEAYNNCTVCYGNRGIWTAVGCVDRNPSAMISKIITIGVGILGGIFLLRILAAAFTFATSQGDVKKTSEAKEMLTEAIIGVLFILFSVTILQFIGSSVLKIPGFGG